MSKTAKNDARSAYYKLYREENRESLKTKRRAYYLANRDHILEKDRIYRSRDDIKAMDRQRRFENSERYSLRQKAYRSRPDIKARDKALRENNRERKLELQRIRRSFYLVKEMIRRARTRARKGQIGGYINACQIAFEEYQALLAAGWPRELARMCLPFSTYSKMFASVDLLNLMKFLQLRDHAHAQFEIRVYAEAMKKLAASIVPECIEAMSES